MVVGRQLVLLLTTKLSAQENDMLVRHYSTNVSGSTYPGKEMADHPRSEINKVFDQDTDTWPKFTSCEDTFSVNSESLYLNFTETDDAIVIEAELSGFGSDEVDVSTQCKSLIIDACRCEEQNKSYYLGDYSQPACRWTIPIGIDMEKDRVKTLFRDGTVIISVMKSVSVTRLVAEELA